eukprot:78940_1
MNNTINKTSDKSSSINPPSPKRRRISTNKNKKLEDFTLNEIDTLNRKQLQSLCKSHKIKANAKTVTLIQKLKTKWIEITSTPPNNNTISIDDIISNDLSQHILSFLPLLSMNIICTKWNTLSKNNFNKYLINKYNTIQLNNKSNKSNTIWIIHPNRTELNPYEITRGFKGPINDLYTAWHECQSGDIWLIHNGKYVIDKNIGSDSSYFMIKWWDKNLSLIGIGNNVNIIDGGDWQQHASYIWTTNNLHFENIIFSVPLLPQNESILSIKNCQFPDTWIKVCDGASAYIENCLFIPEKGDYSAIDIHPNAKNVEIINCEFENFGYSGINMDNESMIIEGEFSCIMIVNYRRNNINVNMSELVEIKIIDNVFKNNLCYPIVERHPITDHIGRIHRQRDTKWIYDTPQKYVLKNNVLCGFNGTAVTKRNNNLIIDANTIYFDDQPESIKCFT